MNKTYKRLSFLEIGPNKTRVIEEYEVELIAFKQDIVHTRNAMKN